MIEFNKNVQPIQLSAAEIPDGTTVQLYGWGDSNVSEKSCFNNLLQKWNFILVKLQIYHSTRVQVINTTISRCGGSSKHESQLCTINKKGEGPCEVNICIVILKKKIGNHFILKSTNTKTIIIAFLRAILAGLSFLTTNSLEFLLGANVAVACQLHMLKCLSFMNGLKISSERPINRLHLWTDICCMRMRKT